MIEEEKFTEAESAFIKELRSDRDGFDLRLLTRLIDERIAAATVQDGYNRIDGGTEWRDNRIMRLKPKGESK